MLIKNKNKYKFIENNYNLLILDNRQPPKSTKKIKYIHI